LIVGPYADHRSHIRLLSKVSTLMNYDDFRSDLLVIKNEIELIEHFKEKEVRQFG
jgi:mannitol/fructose-specific phosphotransferase system IIA component (Ntr-type)